MVVVVVVGGKSLSSQQSVPGTSTITSTSGTVYEGLELLHVDWVQELPEDLDVCIAQRDFEAAVDLIQKSIFDTVSFSTHS